jgi:DNA polymerase (family 10)
VKRFVEYPRVKQVQAEGPTRSAVTLDCGLQVDLRVVPAASLGSALYYFTGSKSHNIAVRALALKRGLKINEYGVFRRNTPDGRPYRRGGIPRSEAPMDSS